MKPYALAVVCVISAAVAAAAQTEIAKASVPGIVNFGYLGKTVACAGATAPAALTEVKKLGYASVINLRVATEPGAEIDASAAAAQAAGLRFIHLPFKREFAGSHAGRQVHRGYHRCKEPARLHPLRERQPCRHSLDGEADGGR
jgi:hypothetical protein